MPGPRRLTGMGLFLCAALVLLSVEAIGVITYNTVEHISVENAEADFRSAPETLDAPDLTSLQRHHHRPCPQPCTAVPGPNGTDRSIPEWHSVGGLRWRSPHR